MESLYIQGGLIDPANIGRVPCSSGRVFPCQNCFYIHDVASGPAAGRPLGDPIDDSCGAARTPGAAHKRIASGLLTNFVPPRQAELRVCFACVTEHLHIGPRIEWLTRALDEICSSFGDELLQDTLNRGPNRGGRP